MTTNIITTKSRFVYLFMSRLLKSKEITNFGHYVFAIVELLSFLQEVYAIVTINPSVIKISRKIVRLVDISAFYICLLGIWQITFDNISEVNTNHDEKWVNRLSISDCSIFVCIWWYTSQCLLLLEYCFLRISHIGRLNKQ